MVVTSMEENGPIKLFILVFKNKEFPVSLQIVKEVNGLFNAMFFCYILLKVKPVTLVVGLCAILPCECDFVAPPLQKSE